MLNLNKKVKNLYSYKIPKLLILGEEKDYDFLKEIVDNYNLDLYFVDFSNLKHAIDDQVIGVLLDEKSLGDNWQWKLEKFRKKNKLIPLYFFAREERTEGYYLRLYEKGIFTVLDWDKDKDRFYNLLIETLKPKNNTYGVSKGDKRLSKVIKAYIAKFGYFPNLKVKAVDGFVFLDGKVKSLYQKENVISQSSEVLGVKKVISKNLKIVNSDRVTDSELTRKIKKFISSETRDSMKSVNIRVKNAKVYLEGCTFDQEDKEAIEKFVFKLHGVRKINLMLTVKENKTNSIKGKAKAIESKILSLFRDIKYVSISFYGDSAEISGIAKSHNSRKLVEDYVLQTLPVNNVINRISV